jgi:hypothetical protein
MRAQSASHCVAVHLRRRGPMDPRHDERHHSSRWHDGLLSASPRHVHDAGSHGLLVGEPDGRPMPAPITIRAGAAKLTSRMGEDFETVIGLECHVELSRRTKMFCGSPNEFGAPPNTNVCPICLGLPGSLPVPNEQAIELHRADRPRAGLRDRPVLAVPPEELLLSGHAEELPDLPVRPSDMRQGTPQRAESPPIMAPRRSRSSETWEMREGFVRAAA